MKIAITAESTIDLTAELLEKYQIATIPFHVHLGEEEYLDGGIAPSKLFEYTAMTGKLPKTSAINEYDYDQFFEKMSKEYDAVIHFCLSSGISVAYSNALRAASRYSNVYLIDTKSLSTGIALQAIHARELANQGVEPAEIVSIIEKRRDHVQASFSLESVKNLYKGGRCSALAMIGANVLGLKPAILVSTKDGKMSAGKKYRGKMIKAVGGYVKDILEQFDKPDLTRVFVTYSTAPQEVIDYVDSKLRERGFKEILHTTAGSTISVYCGENCLGILYYNDGE